MSGHSMREDLSASAMSVVALVANALSVDGDDQPHVRTCTSASVSDPIPTSNSAELQGSGNVRSATRRSSNVRNPTTHARMPNGTPVQNAQRHPPTSTSHAPSDGPDAVATDPTALHIDIANVRRLAGTASSNNATAAGPSIAAPIACTTRAAMSPGTFGDNAAVVDPITNVASPMSATRRCPTRSATTPAGISTGAVTIV